MVPPAWAFKSWIYCDQDLEASMALASRKNSQAGQRERTVNVENERSEGKSREEKAQKLTKVIRERGREEARKTERPSDREEHRGRK